MLIPVVFASLCSVLSSWTPAPKAAVFSTFIIPCSYYYCNDDLIQSTLKVVIEDVNNITPETVHLYDDANNYLGNPTLVDRFYAPHNGPAPDFEFQFNAVGYNLLGGIYDFTGGGTYAQAISYLMPNCP